MKNALTLAQETTKIKGQATNDRRSLVQSVVLSSIPTTEQRLNDKERQLTIPSSREISKVLGLNARTFQQIKKRLNTSVIYWNNLEMECYKQQELYFLK